jgi:hypothetical protein
MFLKPLPMLGFFVFRMNKDINSRASILPMVKQNDFTRFKCE